MNIRISQPKQFRKSVGHCRLFSDISRRKRTNSSERQQKQQKQQKMICTTDTLKNEQSSHCSLNDFDFHFENKLHQFKMTKAAQITDIAIDGDIPVKNIMKRIRQRLESELFEFVHNTIKEMNMYEEKSAQKKTRSPKQLGSTIEHTYTPKSVQTPAFDFESEHNKINEFSVGSNEFTLGSQRQTQVYVKKAKLQKCQIVSQFSVGSRNPTSKRIKDKIMNSKRSHNLQQG